MEHAAKIIFRNERFLPLNSFQYVCRLSASRRHARSEKQIRFFVIH